MRFPRVKGFGNSERRDRDLVGRERLCAGYRNGFAPSVYVLRSISLLSKRLPLRPHYSEALSCYRGLWPRGMYPGRLPWPVPVYARPRARIYVVEGRGCVRARERTRVRRRGWLGVCLRVHYADCWSRPLRRTQNAEEDGERGSGGEGGTGRRGGD